MAAKFSDSRICKEFLYLLFQILKIYAFLNLKLTNLDDN